MADKKQKSTTRFYMWYWYCGKRVRSAEYPSFAAFYEKCGKWCTENPDSWQLCKRTAYESVE